MASCSNDLTIRIWNTQSFQTEKTLQGHDHDITSIEFLPNGEFLVSASRDNTVKMWEVSTGFCAKTFKGHDNAVRTVSVNSKGTLMASGGMDQNVILWTTKKEEKDGLLAILNEHEHAVDCVRFAPIAACRTIQSAASSQVAVEEEDDTLSLTSKASEQPQEGKNSQVRVDDANSEAGSVIEEEKKVSRLEAMREKVAATRKRAAMIRSKQNEEEEEKKSEEPQAEVRDYLASASRDKTIKIWDLKSQTCIATYYGHDNWVTELLFHFNGKFLLSSSDDKTIRIWDLLSGRSIRTLRVHDHFISTIALSQKALASGSVDKSIKLFALT